MAKVLICITGLTGILNASLELARRLEADGQSVTLAAPRDLADRINPTGLSFHRLPTINLEPEPPLPEFSGPTRPLRRLLYRYLNRGERRAAALAATDPKNFVTLLQTLQPDLLICDVELHEYIFTAYGQGQKTVLLSQWYSLWDSPGLPYQLTDLVPGGLQYYDEEITPKVISDNWAELKRKRSQTARKVALLSGGTDRRSTLLTLAKREGFPLDRIQKNFWPGPFTYERMPVLAMAPKEMELPHEPPGFLHYVGPMVRSDRPEKLAVSDNGFTLAEIVDRKQAEGAKLLVCTVSTMPGGQPDDFIARLVEAVRERPDWLLILGTGGQPEVIPGDCPVNVFPFGFVPQLAALAQADLSINHAGIHTIHECLHFAVPMMCYYSLTSDQPGCAVRVHHHGVGLMARRDRDDAGEIRVMLDFILRDEGTKKKVTAMRERITHYADDRVMETLVQRFIDEKTPG